MIANHPTFSTAKNAPVSPESPKAIVGAAREGRFVPPPTLTALRVLVEGRICRGQSRSIPPRTAVFKGDFWRIAVE